MNKQQKFIDLFICDETLRDGAQQVGVNFLLKDKETLMKRFFEAGVDSITLMPEIFVEEVTFAKKMLNVFGSDKLSAVTLSKKAAIDLMADMGFKHIFLFSPVSDRLLKTSNITRKTNLEWAIRYCRYAKGRGMNIIYAAEDVPRADLGYVMHFAKKIEKYISCFLVCDTVGALTPAKTKKLIRSLGKGLNCEIGIHFHNDQGLANENSVIAIKNGARFLSGTFGGIGERAGNADLGRILLKLKRDGLLVKGINYGKLRKITKMVYLLGGSKPAKPRSKRAFWHESGIHVAALLKDPLSYSLYNSDKFGYENKFFFGKLSGVASYKLLFGDAYSDIALRRIRDFVKKCAYERNATFNENEVRKLIDENLEKIFYPKKIKRIAVLEGEGIGKEVIPVAVSVLKKATENSETMLVFKNALVGAEAKKKTGSFFPRASKEICDSADAILFGCVEKEPLLELRKRYDLFANIRPFKGNGVNLTIFRELTGGIYFGKAGNKKVNGEIKGYHTMEYSKREIKRIVEMAFEYCKKNKLNLVSVDKDNALPFIKWRKYVKEVAKKYPDVKYEHMYVDNTIMQLYLKPERFEVIVTSNMFGDLLSDLTGAMTGSIGLAGSASLNEKGFGLFEPIHGTAPDIAGKKIANPIAAINSGIMLLKQLKLDKEARRVEKAIQDTLNECRTKDMYEKGKRIVSTEPMGAQIIKRLKT